MKQIFALVGACLFMSQSACAQERPVSIEQCAHDKPRQIEHYAKHQMKQYSARVIKVSDGDTLQVRDQHGAKQRVRLAFIDAPEMQQASGQDSKRQLSRLVDGQQILVHVVDIDQYKRHVGLVWLAEQDINASQLASGMAWQYASIAKKQQTKQGYEYYRCLEQAAKQSKTGLWRNSKAQAPWEYRRQNRQ